MVAPPKEPLGPRERAEQRLIWIAAGAGIVLAVMLAGLSVLSAAFAHDHGEVVHELETAARLHADLDGVLQLVVDAETAQRGFLLTSDPAFLSPLEHAHQALPTVLLDATSVLGHRHGEALARELEVAANARMDFTDEIVAQYQTGARSLALARVTSGEGRVLTDRLREVIRQAHDREALGVDAILDQAARSQWRAEVAIDALVVVALLLSLTLAWSLRTNLVRNRIALRRGQEEARRFRMLAERARDLVRIHGLDGQAQYVSPSVANLLGFTPEEFLALPATRFMDDADRASIDAIIASAVATHVPPEPFRHHLRRKDGTLRLFETKLELAESESGAIAHLHTLSRDITDEAEEEQRLSVLATQDELTGLLNRRGLLQAGETLGARAEAQAQKLVLLFCDVNGLKAVNDALGHDVGDTLLRDAASVLTRNARGTDVVARLGGDEFVVLGTVRDIPGAIVFRDRVLAHVREQNERSDRPFRLSMSVGSAVREDGESITELLARADAAMYREKGRRGPVTPSGRWVVRSMDRARE
jgi:diguanylate cyclase (GGDEF)-like protein/PAS domain S-box-containing protein